MLLIFYPPAVTQ